MSAIKTYLITRFNKIRNFIKGLLIEIYNGNIRLLQEEINKLQNEDRNVIVSILFVLLNITGLILIIFFALTIICQFIITVIAIPIIIFVYGWNIIETFFNKII
jgi:hypothetical protein